MVDGNDYGNENYGKLPLELIEYSTKLVERIGSVFKYTKAMQIKNRIVFDAGISMRVRMSKGNLEEFSRKMCAYYDILYPEANGGLLIDVAHVMGGQFIDSSVKYLCKLGLGYNGEYGEIKRDELPLEVYAMPILVCLDDRLRDEEGMVVNAKVNWSSIRDEGVSNEGMRNWFMIVN